MMSRATFGPCSFLSFIAHCAKKMQKCVVFSQIISKFANIIKIIDLKKHLKTKK